LSAHTRSYSLTKLYT